MGAGNSTWLTVVTTDGKETLVRGEASSTIQDVKALVCDQTGAGRAVLADRETEPGMLLGISPDRQRLVYAGRALELSRSEACSLLVLVAADQWSVENAG